MVDVGKKRGFNKELASRRGAKYQSAAVEGLPIQPQPPRLQKINSRDLVALPEQRLVSGERSSFNCQLVECLHRPSKHPRPKRATSAYESITHGANRHGRCRRWRVAGSQFERKSGQKVE